MHSLKPVDMERGLQEKNRGVSLPAYFFWLEAGVMAGSNVPQTVRELEAMVKDGVAWLVSLSQEKPPEDPVAGLTRHCIDVRDFEGPTLEQFEEFIEICEVAASTAGGVAVHCRGGNGRTGTLLAAYLLWKRGLAVKEAVAEVRRFRSRAVETQRQLEALDVFHKFLKDRAG